MADVESVRQDLEEFLPKYELLQDILGGELKVKAAGTKYLPVPNENTTSIDARYQAYLTRAVFYNVTSRTLEGLTGQVFLRDPIVEIPELLEHIEKDANGANVDLIQLAKRATEFTLAYGRCGIFTDYPAIEEEATQEEIRDGLIRPTLNLYAPWNITNWKRQTINSKSLLTMVVLKEFKVVENPDQPFKLDVFTEYRVLRLRVDFDGDLFTHVTLWSDINKNGQFEIVDEYNLLDSEGNPLSELPFDFIGSQNNDDVIDEPPMYDIASLNIAHYRNSADYEESAFMVGQPTPWFSGLTENWVQEVWKGGIVLGARSAVPLPERGDAGLLQAEPNSLAFEAMEHKEKQMMALGAKLVQERRIEATATEIEMQNASEDSVLTTIAKNVTSAFQTSLQRAAIYLGQSFQDIKFELNSNFDLTTMTADETRILAELWANFSAISTSEMREGMRRSGLAKLTDEEFEKAVKTDKALKDTLGINEQDTESGSDNRSTGATN